MKALDEKKRHGLRLAQFLALLLMGIELGVSYSHFLQMPGKAELSPAVLILVQTVLIQYKVGLGVIEVGTMVAMLTILWLGRHQWQLVWLTVGALLLLVSAFGVWAAFIEPINQAVDTWAVASSVPANWEGYRDRWHQFHLLRLGLLTLSTSSLISSVLAKHSAPET